MDTPCMAATPVDALAHCAFHKHFMALPNIVRDLSDNGWFGYVGHFLVASRTSRKRPQIGSTNAKMLDDLPDLCTHNVGLHQQTAIWTQGFEYALAAGQDPSTVVIGQSSQSQRIWD